MPIQHGSKELRDKDGNPVRADIVVYASKAACLNRDQGKINFVVECKRNKVEDGYAPAGLVHLQHQRQWWRLDEW